MSLFLRPILQAYIEHFMERSGEFSPELELDTKDLQVRS
jgi:hypothetical protein